MKEQTELVDQYVKTESVLQEKCLAAEAARDTYAKQLEDAKVRINGFCESFEKSNAAFKQLQDQMDMSNKIQKKMQQESDLLKKRSDLVQQKSERLIAENERLLEQVLLQSCGLLAQGNLFRWMGCVGNWSIPCRLLITQRFNLRKEHLRSSVVCSKLR